MKKTPEDVPTKPSEGLNKPSAITELFDISPIVAVAVLVAASLVLVFGTFLFINSAPPKQIHFISGPKGSKFYKTALNYKEALDPHGVEVQVLTSNGTVENLDRITDPESHVDVALIQSGIVDKSHDLSHVLSLGAVGNQPVFFFYRGEKIDQLVQTKGMRLAVGHPLSGTRKIALKLLALNGISEQTPHKTRFLDFEAEGAIQALVQGQVDGAFVMTEKVSMHDLKMLMREPDIHLLDFQRNAAAYVRKVDFLNLLDIPEGLIDFELNIPSYDVTLIGPMAEIIVNKDLHPALSDLILDAALHIHSHPEMFQKRNEFPQAIEQAVVLSDDAIRFYKSGKTLLYRHLSFWVASLINRIIFVIIPMLVVLIPVVRLIPWLFRWRNQLRIRRMYRSLMKIEENYKQETNAEKLDELHKNFEKIDQQVRDMRIRPAYADQFYHLRGHIDYVRRLMGDRRS